MDEIRLRLFTESESIQTAHTPAGDLERRMPEGQGHAAEVGAQITLCGLATDTLVEFGIYYGFASIPAARRCPRCNEEATRAGLA
jgi:hypothetical protein